MKPYRSSGRVPFGGFIGLMLATVIGSLVIGGLVYLLSQFVYLIILFPFLMGALGGGILALVVKSSRVRSPIIAGIFGLLIGVGTIGVLRFAEYYLAFRDEVRTTIINEVGEDVPQQEIDEFTDLVLEEETGSTGFIGYLKYSAKQGTTISRNAGSTQLDLDETATWGLWIVELLIVAGTAAAIAFKSARQPFNEEAGMWYPAGEWVGSVDWKQRKDFYKTLKNGDSLSAFKMVTGNNLPAPRVDIFVQRTPEFPQTDVILNVKETRLNRRREITADKLKGLLSPGDFSTLTRMTGVSSAATGLSATGAPVTESMS